jgi:hypothetical protein
MGDHKSWQARGCRMCMHAFLIDLPHATHAGSSLRAGDVFASLTQRQQQQLQNYFFLMAS